MQHKKSLLKVFVEAIGVVILISSGVFLLTYKLPMVSATYDEGFSYLANGEYLVKNFRWDRPYILLHPPLSYYLHGWSSLVAPTSDQDLRLLIARVSMVPIYILFSLCLYLLVRHWYGVTLAIFVICLYLFNPEILSHARLITPDHLLAFTSFLTLISFYFFLTKPKSIKYILLSGIFLGLAMLSKYTALLLVPLLILLTIIYSFRIKKTRRNFVLGLLGIVLIAFFLLHAGYLFRETGRLPTSFVSPQFTQLTQIPGVKPLLLVLFPRAYLEGVDFQMHESGKGVWWGYFAGKYYVSGLWYFYPAVFLIKAPIPLLALLILSGVLLARKKLKTQPFITQIILLTTIWFFIYFMFFNKLIIGLRYLLFIYPFLFLLVAPVVNLKLNKSLSKLYRIALMFLLFWYVAGVVKIAPFYLAFANETIGGPKNLWKYVGDSNLDWNQDQKFFAEYRKLHPEITLINPHQPTVGKFAVNVNDMNLYYFGDYEWLRDLNKDPIDYVGYTWLIFEVNEGDLDK